MSGTLEPGTRIPTCSKVVIKQLDELHLGEGSIVHSRRHDPFDRLVGIAEGFCAGTLFGALCLALAWSHLGG